MIKPKRNNRGQFVIITALIISILTLSLALSIHEINLHRQIMQYRPINEFLLGTTSDLERALTHSLSKYSTAILDQTPTPNDSQFMKNWTESMLTSFASYGIRIKDPLLPTWDCHWNGTTTYSLAAVTYNIDVDSYGFKGWMGRSCKYVQLKIFNESILTESATTSFNFTLKESTINEDATVPIPGLPQKPDLQSFRVGNYTPSQPFDPATEVSLQYYGNGKYRVTFNQTVDPNTLGVRLDLATPVDKVWVSANYFNNSRDWSTLHFIPNKLLEPNYLYTPGTSDSYKPSLNKGNPSVNMTATAISPTIVTASLINITVYLTSVPPSAVKTLTSELGFIYNDQYYPIGNATIDISGRSSPTPYEVSINVDDNVFVTGFEPRTIPDGSLIQLNITLSFRSQSGSGKVYYDGNTPSQINLY
jgi:hypothetical protein